MNSAEWVLGLEDQDGATRHAAAVALLDVQSAKVRLEQAQLEDIRDRLSANEAELAGACRDLERALKSLERVRAILDQARRLTGVVATVMAKI